MVITVCAEEYRYNFDSVVICNQLLKELISFELNAV